MLWSQINRIESVFKRGSFFAKVSKISGDNDAAMNSRFCKVRHGERSLTMSDMRMKERWVPVRTRDVRYGAKERGFESILLWHASG